MDETIEQMDPWALLDRYLAGECTPTEAAEVQRRLDGSAHDAIAIQQVVAQLRGANARPLDARVGYTELRANICDERQEERPRLWGVSRRSSGAGKALPLGKWTLLSGLRGEHMRLADILSRRLAVTGAIVLMVIGSIILYNSGSRSLHTSPARVYSTPVGQQVTISLADGSRVHLGPATTLSVRTASDASVDVYVIGQVLFTVAHHQDRTFRVHTGNAVARILGTAFMVRRYTVDHVTRVVVMEGRVSLSGMRDGAFVGTNHVLSASMMGTVDDSGQVQTRPHVAVEDYTAWASGKLVLHNTPAQDAVTELGRAYGVDIRISDSVRAARPLTWTIPLTQQSLTDVLEALAEVLDAHPVRTGRIITLVAGRSAQRRPAGPLPLSTTERQYGK